MARLILRQTCESHPEQYDAYKGANQVAYFRLRHGRFAVRMPDVNGDIVYESLTLGDGLFDGG